MAYASVRGLEPGDKITTMINIVQGRVKFPADKDWPSTKADAPDYTSLKVDVSGQEVRVFCNVGTPDYNLAKSYKKGDPVTLSEDKGKYKLVGAGGEMSDAVRSTTLNQPTTPLPEKAVLSKAEMKAKALQYSELYREIYTDLVLAMPAEQAQSGATTVFNQLSRLFS